MSGRMLSIVDLTPEEVLALFTQAVREAVAEHRAAGRRVYSLDAHGRVVDDQGTIFQP